MQDAVDSAINNRKGGTKMAGQLYSPAKLAEALGISAGKVKKLLDELKIKEDSVKGVCKYYGEAALKRLKAAAK
jgi:hypothetical protein